MTPALKQQMASLLNQSWCKATLILSSILVLAMFTGQANWTLKFTYFSKYIKVLYLPLLALAFQNKRSRTFAINAFLLSMCITIAVSVFKNFNFVDINKPLLDSGAFLNRIDTGLLVAFAAYLSALQAFKPLEKKRWLYLMLSTLFSSYSLFVNSSRTGYLVFSVLFLVFILQHISWRKLFIYLPILAVFCGVVASQSPTLKYHVQLAFQDFKQFQQGSKSTSLGYRLQFAEYAHKIFKEKPILGHGDGGFAYRFILDNPVPDWGPALGDPHNQYWGFLVDYGLIGLLFLFYWFFTIYQSTRDTDNHSLIVGVLAAFLAANWCDSFLLLANGGYFFILFSALVLGDSLSQNAQTMETIPKWHIEAAT